MTKNDKTGLVGLLGIFTLARLVVSAAFRMVYPFLPALSRGLGVPIETVAAAIGARSALGFFGPVLGALADRGGRKQALVLGLVVFGLSLLAVGAWPVYNLFFIGLVLSGGATVVIDSSIHAYLGDRIPYAQRGRATALVESGWSLAFLLAIPALGWIMARSGWSLPFIWMGGAGLLVAGLVGIFVPRLPPASNSYPELLAGLRSLFQRGPLLGLLLALLTVIANQIVNIVFGIWMEDTFNLQLEQVGAASSVIGVAGIGGLFLAMLFTDRLGKRRSIGLGLLINSLACLLLPIFGRQLWGTLMVLFLFYMSFEFTLTSLLTLMTALSIQARGALMAATLASFSLGDSIGAMIGPLLIHAGLLANASAAVICNLLGLFLLVGFIRPAEEQPESFHLKEVV